MEKWQKEYITDNLPNLIQDINCNVALLSYLCKMGVLADGDVQKVNSRGGNEGEQEKVFALLQILPTRSSAYEHLAKALYHGKQTGAVLTLLYGVQINIPQQNPFQFCGIDINPDDILSKPVIFQGCKLPLKDVCNPINIVRLQNLVHDHLNISLYKEFLGESPVTIAVGTIPKALPYFIPRSLSMNSEVDLKIFEERKKDIFLVEGIELFHLSRLAKLIKNAEIDRSGNQVHRLTAQFILLEHQDHFPDIVRQTGKLVHWLSYNNGRYIYIKSSSGEGITVVKSFLKSKNEKIISQDEFSQMCLDALTRNPILIYDSPGMGKSILLAQLAREIKNKEPHRSVLFFPFSQFIKQVTANQEKIIHSDTLKQAVIRISTVNTFGHHITQELLDTPSHHIELFLDAFDEVPESDLESAQKILNCISNELKNFRVFITTRPHLSGKLEETFGVLGFNIMPFDDTNQSSFFLKYWENEHYVVTTEEVKLFAQSCLKTLTSEMSGEDGNIAGIPLQCKMLAEIYAPDAKRGALMTTESQFRINSVFKMYDEYIRMKFGTVSDDEEREIMQKFHIQQALKTIFPEQIISGNLIDDIDLDAVYKIGIMEPNKSDPTLPEFVHRTLAEFIVAEYMAEALFGNVKQESTDEQLVNLLFGEALIVETELVKHGWRSTIDLGIVKFSGPVVVQFLNCIISNRYAQVQVSPNLKNALKKSKYYESETFCNLVNASLRSNLSSLFILFLTLFLDLVQTSDGQIDKLSFQDDLLESSSWEFKDPSKFKLVSEIPEVSNLSNSVRIAAKHSSLELVKATCNLVYMVTGKNFHEFTYERPEEYKELDKTPIHLAARRGHYLIFKYLSESHEEIKFDEVTLWLCIYLSARTSPAVVKDKLDILKEIVENNPNLLTKDCLVTKHVFRCHYDLIHYLIKAGADVNASNKHGNNVTHVVSSFFSPEEYENFLDLMISKNYRALFMKRGKSRRTAFHTALKYIELKTETLEIIAKEFNVDFNDRFTLDGSELACAIKGGRSRRVLEDIVRLGGNWKSIYVWGSAIAEVIPWAVDNDNIEAVKYFISLGADVNKRYVFNLVTPLGMALCDDLDEIAKILVENGADVNAPFLPSPELDELYVFPITARMVAPITYVRSETKSPAVVALLEKSGAQPATLKSSCANVCTCCCCWPCCLCACCFSVYETINDEYC